MKTKALLDKETLASQLGERRIWQPDEARRLATLPLTHGYFYWLILRPMCDPVTQRLGEQYRVSWDFLSAQFVFWSHKKLDKQQLRRITHKLESVGLIHKIHHPQRLIFHLPFATELAWLESLLIRSNPPFSIPLATPVSPSMGKASSDTQTPSVNPFAIPSGIPPDAPGGTGVPFGIPPDREMNDSKFNTLEVSQWAAMIPLVRHWRETVCLYLYILLINILLNNNKKAHFKNETSALETAKSASRQATWFDQFWQLYPVKKSKKRAKALFDRLVHDERDFERIVMAVKAQLSEREALEAQRACGADVFIPAWKYPTTWLNQGCWDDEVNEVPAWPNQPAPYPTIKRFWANADLSDIDYGGEEYD